MLVSLVLVSVYIHFYSKINLKYISLPTQLIDIDVKKVAKIQTDVAGCLLAGFDLSALPYFTTRLQEPDQEDHVDAASGEHLPHPLQSLSRMASKIPFLQPLWRKRHLQLEPRLCQCYSSLAVD